MSELQTAVAKMLAEQADIVAGLQRTVTEFAQQVRDQAIDRNGHDHRIETLESVQRDLTAAVTECAALGAKVDEVTGNLVRQASEFAELACAQHLSTARREHNARIDAVQDRLVAVEARARELAERAIPDSGEVADAIETAEQRAAERAVDLERRIGAVAAALEDSRQQAAADVHAVERDLSEWREKVSKAFREEAESLGECMRDYADQMGTVKIDVARLSGLIDGLQSVTREVRDGRDGRDADLTTVVEYVPGRGYPKGALVTYRRGLFVAVRQASPGEEPPSPMWKCLLAGIYEVMTPELSKCGRVMKCGVILSDGSEQRWEERRRAVVHQKRWNPDRAYKEDDEVAWKGSTYRAAKDLPAGVEPGLPGIEDTWISVSMKGDRGKPGNLAAAGVAS